ncbi:MAG: ABC transporter ATP-binding protein [Anaerolineales bacterium]
MTKWLIEASGLTKDFRTLTAVKDVDLRVAEGEILALLGPNGAGKTTTIRMLASLLRPSAGTATVAGYSVTADAQQVRSRVGLLTEHHGLYTRMQAPNYLQFFAEAYGLPRDEIKPRVSELLNQFDLAETIDLQLGQYSRGMRQKLALARALLHNPPVLMLDEPTSAMDPSSARMVRERIRGLRSSKRAIIVCTHNLSEAEGLADRIAIIRRGRIIASGTTLDLKQQLLGDPIMEVRLAGAVNGAEEALPDEVSRIAAGVNWIRYRVHDPDSLNPLVLRSLSEVGAQVVTLSEVGRTLEDVYLEVVGMADRAEMAAG